jgi:hypothetical protein
MLDAAATGGLDAGQARVPPGVGPVSAAIPWCADERGTQPACSIQTSAVPPMEIRMCPNATVLE